MDTNEDCTHPLNLWTLDVDERRCVAYELIQIYYKWVRRKKKKEEKKEEEKNMIWWRKKNEEEGGGGW